MTGIANIKWDFLFSKQKIKAKHNLQPRRQAHIALGQGSFTRILVIVDLCDPGLDKAFHLSPLPILSSRGKGNDLVVGAIEMGWYNTLIKSSSVGAVSVGAVDDMVQTENKVQTENNKDEFRRKVTRFCVHEL